MSGPDDANSAKQLRCTSEKLRIGRRFGHPTLLVRNPGSASQKQHVAAGFPASRCIAMTASKVGKIGPTHRNFAGKLPALHVSFGEVPALCCCSLAESACRVLPGLKLDLERLQDAGVRVRNGSAHGGIGYNADSSEPQL